MSTNYHIIVGDYTKNHFIKNFKKKYKSAWIPTYESIEFICSRPEKSILFSTFNQIYIDSSGGYIGKGEFSIAGTNISPKSSGCRFISYVNVLEKTSTLLLVYCKNDIKGSNETVWWENEIKTPYESICKNFDF